MGCILKRKLLNKLRWWPTALVAAAILWLTLAPHPVPETQIELFEGADKVVHAIMFFALAFALIFDLWIGKRKVSLITCLYAALAVTAFAAVDEWAQGAMGLGRTSDLLDFFADCSGILLALLFASIIFSHRQ